MKGAILVVLLVQSWPVLAKVEEVKDIGDGKYIQALDGVKDVWASYFVDATAQLCFLNTARRDGGVATTLIPCVNLAKRPEWAKIITWIESSAPSR